MSTADLICLPRVSVVIPCYNQGHFLYESISSALDAYSGELEIIVVDDGSTDPKTEKYLVELTTFSPAVKIIRQDNKGLSEARNTGIAHSTGELIQLLDADDILVAGKLDAQVAHFTTAGEMDISICNFFLCDATRTHFSKPEETITRFDLSLDDFLFKWERGFIIPIHCALFRRSVFDNVWFDTDLKAKEDWLFWCSLIIRGYHMACLNAHLAIYRQHEGSMRLSVVNMAKNWLKAALKIDAMLNGSHPLFFESSVLWLEQAYRGHPHYKNEIAELQHGSNLRLAPHASGYPKVSEITDTSVDTSSLLKHMAILDVSGLTPLITVVVPVFNHFPYLSECLASLADQGDVPIEVICVDDASTDLRVTAVMQTLHSRLRNLRVISHTVNRGISFSQNEAVKAAVGEFIAFVDCDDALPAKALERVFREIKDFPGVDYFFSDRLDIDEDGKVIRTALYGGYESIRPSGDIRNDLLDGMVTSHLKVIRRSTYMSVGGSDDFFSGVQDWELALKIAEIGTFRYIPEPLYCHRIHGSSVTYSDRVSQFRKTNILRRKFAERWLSPHYGDNSFRSVMKKNIEKNMEEIGNTGCAKFLPNNKLTVDPLKQAWKAGRLCIMDMRGEYNKELINFLREFNSYFDLILYENPEVYGALVGYLWQKSILFRA